MCAGDGLADIVGRRYGASNRWPWSDENKSAAGTAAFACGAAAVNLALIAWFARCGLVDVALAAAVPRVCAISALCAAIETVNLPGINDNFSVPLLAAGLAWKLF